MSANPTTFYNVLVEFTGNITAAFAENQGAQLAHTMLQMAGGIPSSHPEMVTMWYDLSLPVIEDVKNKNPAPVAAALDACPNKLISNINSTSILCSDEVSTETKDAMWKFLQTLTALSQMIQPTLADPSKPAPEIPESAVRAPQSIPAVPSVNLTPPTPSPSPVPQAAPQAKTKPQDVVKSITSAMPEIFKSLNEMMKNPGEDNPLGAMLCQMMNPDALQTGLAPNVGANLMQRDPGPAMSHVAANTGMAEDEIMKKLAKLELYEKARAKRKGKKNA